MSKHKQIPLSLKPQLVSRPRDLDESMLIHCRTWRDAVRVGIRHSYYLDTENALASRLGMSAGNLSLILNKGGNRARYFDADRFREVEQILGNRCISQFFELQSKGLLVSDRAMTDEEKARAYDDLMRASA